MWSERLDNTPPENLTQVCRSWGPRIVNRHQFDRALWNRIVAAGHSEV
jgi:hypothetical protein